MVSVSVSDLHTIQNNILHGAAAAAEQQHMDSRAPEPSWNDTLHTYAYYVLDRYRYVTGTIAGRFHFFCMEHTT